MSKEHDKQRTPYCMRADAVCTLVESNSMARNSEHGPRPDGLGTPSGVRQQMEACPVHSGDGSSPKHWGSRQISSPCGTCWPMRRQRAAQARRLVSWKPVSSWQQAP